MAQIPSGAVFDAPAQAGAASDAESGPEDWIPSAELPMLGDRHYEHRRVRTPGFSMRGFYLVLGTTVILLAGGIYLFGRAKRPPQTLPPSAAAIPLELDGVPSLPAGFGGQRITQAQGFNPQAYGQQGNVPAPVAAAEALRQGLGRAAENVRQFPVTIVDSLARAGVPGLPTMTITWTTTVTFTTTMTYGPCGLIEDNYNYPGNTMKTIPSVGNAEVCCNLCAAEVQCLGWSWGKQPGMVEYQNCYLKTNVPRVSVTKLYDTSFTSGSPLQAGRQMPTHVVTPGQSLYCFSLVVPGGYEPEMIKMQWEQRRSIFQCDEPAVFSNQLWEVAPGVTTTVIQSDLQCGTGGEFGTALNTQIFMAVWQVVVQTLRYQKHDWTVKVDPDAVFFPVRLRGILAGYAETPAGTYLNNCRRGMHGPLEVFSRNAVNSWWNGKDRCQQHFADLCQGDCQWGEDMFIDQCLSKVLYLKRIYDERLLIEEHCDPPPGWRGCNDPNIVALHPFKTPAEYIGCVSRNLR